jgi:F-type H+-transporting ATPase subunit b
VELSWPTFFLEIVNFLVLVWILKRFLYKPILQAIAQRKAAIEKNLADAKARQNDAEALEQQFQKRLADWENEKEKLRTGLMEEIADRRAQLLAALDDSLKQERDKARVLEERRLNELRANAEAAGAAAGVQFTARLLDRAASPEVEAKLIELALEDLHSLPADQVENLRAACRHAGLQIKVTSAFAVSAGLRDAIELELKKLTEDSAAVKFAEEGSLRAGLRISIGPWVLRANLADELEFFAHGITHERDH